MAVTLIVFDQSFQQIPPGDIHTPVDLFPLTSDWNIVAECKDAYSGKGTDEANLINSAERVDTQISRLRQDIPGWSANLGNTRINGRTIKEWMCIEGAGTSCWWFSLLSEKNPFKTDLFLKLAQFHAVVDLLKTNQYTDIRLNLKDSELERSIEAFARPRGITTIRHGKRFKRPSLFHNLGLRLADWIDGIRDLVSGFLWLVVFLLRSITAKSFCGSGGRPKCNDSILFVSYFPSVDMDALDRGEFRNKYAIPLQEKMGEAHRRFIWLFLYVNIDGWGFKDAVKIAKRVKSLGEDAYLLHEFFSVRMFLGVLKSWAGRLSRYRQIRSGITHEALSRGLTLPQAYSILQPLFRHSFLGQNALEGLVYFSVFRQIFKQFHEAGSVLYYAEMQGWERALNAARNIHAPQVKSTGFQHTSLSENYFHYYFDAAERKPEQNTGCLPLPDIFASNGKIPCALLSKSDYPNLTILESVRQFYLNELLSLPCLESEKQKVLLVAGTIFYDETSALISMITHAFPTGDRPFRIWLKGHPSMPIKKVLDTMGVDLKTLEFEIKEDQGQTVYDLLKEASVVLTATSTIGIEALAFDCDVIIPVFSDFLCMSPLIGFDAFHHTVYTPEALKKTVCSIFERQKPEADFELKQGFINNYWDLDPSLNKWMHTLEIK